jgi:hypothetical protein
VAKTRRTAKKGGSSKAARPAPKAKGKKPAIGAKRAKSTKAGKPKKPAAPQEKRVYLKELRKQFGLVLSALSAKEGASPEVESKLDDTRKRISQWMTDIDDICTPELQEICGPDMAIPVP